jgi:hypothetical protein
MACVRQIFQNDKKYSKSSPIFLPSDMGHVVYMGFMARILKLKNLRYAFLSYI